MVAYSLKSIALFFKNCIQFTLIYRSIELRKVKCLGGNRIFKRITPDDLCGNFQRPSVAVEEEGDAEEVLGVCKAVVVPHEPLILWTDPLDDKNVIQVHNFVLAQ